MKNIFTLLLITLIGGSNGCMTYSSVQDAKGHPEKAMWIVGTHPSPNPDSKPQPAYYALLPLTVPADIATSPFQLIYYLVLTTSGDGP
jgi:hypothetical protein